MNEEFDSPDIYGASERQIQYAKSLRDKYISKHMDRFVELDENEDLEMNLAEEICYNCCNAHEIISFFKDISNQFSLQFSNVLKKLSFKKGLYFFFNKEGKVVYIGKSTNLKERIVSSLEERKRCSSISKCSYLTFDSMADADVMEIVLINELRPTLNTDCKRRGALTMFNSGIDIYKLKKYKIFEEEE